MANVSLFLYFLLCKGNEKLQLDSRHLCVTELSLCPKETQKQLCMLKILMDEAPFNNH